MPSLLLPCRTCFTACAGCPVSSSMRFPGWLCLSLMGVIGGSRLSSYLVDAAMQVGCGKAAWAVNRQTLALPAKCCRVSSNILQDCPLGLGSPTSVTRSSSSPTSASVTRSSSSPTSTSVTRGRKFFGSCSCSLAGIRNALAFFVPYCARDSVYCVSALPGLRRVCSLLPPRVALHCQRRPLLGPLHLRRSRRTRALSHVFLQWLLLRIYLVHGQYLLREQRRGGHPLTDALARLRHRCAPFHTRRPVCRTCLSRTSSSFLSLFAWEGTAVPLYFVPGVPCDHSHRRIDFDVPLRLCDPRRRGPPI